MQYETIALEPVKSRAHDISLSKGLAPLIAVVGADGSGKTTVCNALLPVAQQFGPVEIAHLGTRSGALGRKIKALPVIGPLLFGRITSKATDARSKEKKIPGLGTALVIFGFSLYRLIRFKRVLKLRQKGVIVLTDRYPQVDVPGFFDGPGLSAAQAKGPLVAWLSRREKAHYDWMVGHAPSLVIRLNVDLETAFARKPDHRYESLRSKCAAAPKLTYGDAAIVELDSRDPFETVREQAEQALTRCLVRELR